MEAVRLRERGAGVPKPQREAEVTPVAQAVAAGPAVEPAEIFSRSSIVRRSCR
jgi:hypothetical protein